MALTREDIPDLTHDELMEHLRLSKVNSDEYEGLFQLLADELALREPAVNYCCEKCGHGVCEEREIQTAGGAFGSVFGVQTEKYRVVSCARCKYSELYHGRTGLGQQAFDFLVGS